MNISLLVMGGISFVPILLYFGVWKNMYIDYDIIGGYNRWLKNVFFVVTHFVVIKMLWMRFQEILLMT